MSEWWEGTFEERMARRAARRLAETPEWLRDTPEEAAALRLRILKRHQKALGALVAKPPEKRRGPRGGVVDFDYEEYHTKMEDRKAADPEAWQRRVKARKEANREFWDNYKLQSALDGANKEIADDLKDYLAVGWTRLRCIWWAVVDAENEQKWRTSPLLSQRTRIAAAPRIRGCGAAAKRAGFAA